MRLDDAQRLAQAEFTRWGLTNRWTFGFDRATKRFGHCKHGTIGRITISRPLTLVNDEAEVLDVIRHEVAHALVGPGKGHGLEWQRKAREVGARPEACYSVTQVVAVPAPWYLVCAPCGYREARHRQPKRTYRHIPCGRAVTIERA